MVNFHETIMGKRFFDVQLPELTKAVKSVADAIKESNSLLVKKQEEREKKEQPSNEIKVKISENRYISVVVDDDPYYLAEVQVMLEDNTGSILQYLCTARPSLDEETRNFTEENGYEVLVYGDCNREDYTNKYSIGDYFSPLEKMVRKTYDLYISDWCKQRNYDIPGPDFDYEKGYNGECFVSIGEFECNEFEDKEYIKTLLSEDEFPEYLEIIKKYY